ncbi:glycoside hydrolase family 16 protein [Bacteroidales bacterium OttesenSCG-928-K03]|nr:glycoside hydrolase family 16 protein [Bacteroidales bacterium OttesenSCG-928-K03]
MKQCFPISKILLLLIFSFVFISTTCDPVEPIDEPDDPENPEEPPINPPDTTYVLTRDVTSGKVNTFNKFSFKYGRMDVYAKLPSSANGLWPAIWMMGADFNGYSPNGNELINVTNANWPECGEIDIVEMGNAAGIAQRTQDRFLSRGTHWGSVVNGGHPNYAINDNYHSSLQDDFHLFVFTWDDAFIKMYVDPQLDENNNLIPENIPYYEILINVYDGVEFPVGEYFHKEYFILLNLAVGGHFTGIYDVDNVSALNEDNNYEAKMYIDYIKVFENNKTNTNFPDEALVWQDLFDDDVIDASKWNIEVNGNGGGNNEIQKYSQDNVIIDYEPTTGKKCLVITAKREYKCEINP